MNEVDNRGAPSSTGLFLRLQGNSVRKQRRDQWRTQIRQRRERSRQSVLMNSDHNPPQVAADVVAAFADGALFLHTGLDDADRFLPQLVPTREVDRGAAEELDRDLAVAVGENSR